MSVISRAYLNTFPIGGAVLTLSMSHGKGGSLMTLSIKEPSKMLAFLPSSERVKAFSPIFTTRHCTITLYQHAFGIIRIS